MEVFCLSCKKYYKYYIARYAAIPPAGIYLSKGYSKDGEFICDNCIEEYYQESNDFYNFIHIKQRYYEDKTKFSIDLLDAIKFFLPNIFKLSRNHISIKLRAQILKKYNYTCVNCGSKNNLTIDHKLAYSKGGDETPDNLQVLCRKCNSKKGTK